MILSHKVFNSIIPEYMPFYVHSTSTNSLLYQIFSLKGPQPLQLITIRHFSTTVKIFVTFCSEKSTKLFSHSIFKSEFKHHLQSMKQGEIKTFIIVSAGKGVGGTCVGKYLEVIYQPLFIYFLISF